MKIWFFWTGEFSKNILKDILEKNEIEVALCVSQQDKPVWRKQELIPTEVKVLSLEKNIPLLQPEKLRNNKDFFEHLKTLNLDFIVVVAYWKIIPREILEIPKFWCINIHGSILPKYRWASPIQEAIKLGETKTWLTIMYMSEGMDEWDILDIKEVEIDIIDTSIDIFKKFEIIWTELLTDTLKKIVKWEINAVKQVEKDATYCSKIDKKDGIINWKEETAKEIYDKFRAYTPWPWIYSYYNNKKISFEDCFYYEIDLSDDDELIAWDVLEIENEHYDEKNPSSKNKEIWILCKKWIFIIKKVKLEWKNTMDINTFINWYKEFINYTFN